jgi:hypothetical protein
VQFRRQDNEASQQDKTTSARVSKGSNPRRSR